MTSPARDATEIVAFNFHGDLLDVVRLPDGDVAVALRRLCETLGIDSEGQRQRLVRASAQGARWATACMVQAVAADGRHRDMLVLPRRSIPMWAATVDPSCVSEDIREKLVAYQDEAADVLAARFVDGVRAPTFTLTRATALKFLVDEAMAANHHGAAVAFLNAARALEKQLSLPGVDVGPPKPRDLTAYHNRILAALADGPLVTRDLASIVRANRSRFWEALRELVTQGRIAVQRDGARHLYSLVHQPTENLQ